jgi:inward rectifier potassium channel-like protein
VRIANGRMTLLTNDMVRLGVVLLEESPEGHLLRRLHDLALSNALFPLAWTVMHEIDENSPLADYDAERFKGAARLFLTIEARDPVQGLRRENDSAIYTYNANMSASRIVRAPEMSWMAFDLRSVGGSS